MNMRPEEKLSRALADAVQAAQQVPTAAVEAAQQRLAASLQARPHREQPTARRWAMGGLAAAAALMLAICLPLLLLPQRDAFATAQAHFRHFRTLQMDVAQRQGDAVLQTSRTRVNAAGATRTDIGESLSVIVDPARGRVLTLLHEQRQAAVATITPQAAASGGDIAWLDELRRYTGKARPLREARLIAGQPARGWLLDLRGNASELWVDGDNLPLELHLRGSSLQIDYRFTFDADFAPGLFDTAVPAGYAQVEADED